MMVVVLALWYSSSSNTFDTHILFFLFSSVHVSSFGLTYFHFLWQSYQILCEKYPSFRERSENVDLVVEISLQPWKVFRPDGVRCTEIYFVMYDIVFS